MKKTHTAVIFVADCFEASYPLTREEVSGFTQGFSAACRAAGGGAELCVEYVLPGDEEEVRGLPTDEYSGVEQKEVDKALAAHQKNLDSQKLAWDAPCDGTCGGTEFGECNHDRHPRP